MRSFQGMIALAVVAAPFVAAADPSPDIEGGLFAGTFLSNFYSRFYDDAKWTAETRPKLSRVSAQFGARYAYFPWRLLGFEAEGTLALAGIETHDDTAKLYGLGLQAIVQYPVGRWIPFAAVGGGILHESSNTLGTDTEALLHAGGGVRYFLSSAVALRFDARFLRGPATSGAFGASYGEFALGVSWVPGASAELGVPEAEDPDPDRDGVLGRTDACPMEPGGGNPDGCPTRDKDGDGIPDPKDQCPELAETRNGFQDDDGCPDQLPDTDHDGLVGTKDQCPLEPEDKDGFQDDDGCPDPDNDGDGVLDANDKCPLVKGPAENNGCPEIDTDADGVPDRLDNCPEEAGKNHGCKAKQVAWITGDRITAEILFTKTDKLGDSARPLLDETARIVAAHPAKLVVKYLASKGIAADRLQAVGLADANSVAVELHIE